MDQVERDNNGPRGASEGQVLSNSRGDSGVPNRRLVPREGGHAKGQALMLQGRRKSDSMFDLVLFL